MANHFVRRIKEIDAQLAALDAIIAKGSYVGAGLSIALHVGPARDRAPALTADLAFEVEPFLAAMRQSLVESRKMNLSMARSELRSMEAYLAPPAQK